MYDIANPKYNKVSFFMSYLVVDIHACINKNECLTTVRIDKNSNNSNTLFNIWLAIGSLLIDVVDL